MSELSAQGRIINPHAPKTCLVNARLLYVFSQAHCLGAGEWASKAANRAFNFLTSNLLTSQGGWRTQAPVQSALAAQLYELYDHAFVLFGLAWWYRASGDRTALGLAARTMAFLDRTMGDRHGGWRENPEGRLPRRQNPHMHLLEAFQALFEATRDPEWIDRARSIIHLFRSRFFDAETDTLREFLNADLSPLPGQEGLLREPGHHMEWVWLLLHQRRLTGDDTLLDFANRLYVTARNHGVNDKGLVVEAMSATGDVLVPSTLLWPQTEAVKAALARHEFVGESTQPAEVALEAMFRYHLPDDGPLWINHIAADGRVLSESVPTRVLYHLTLSIAETLRILGNG